MGMSVIPIPGGTYSILNQISTRLANEGIWTNPNYYISNPSHPVSQMKIAAEKVINAGFAINNQIAISEIWSILEQKPFGLQNNFGSVFLLGFMLKEYGDSRYHKYDGTNPTPMNYSVLSDLIFGIVKDNPKAKGQFIMKQTPEHIEFCKITGSIFKIAADKQTSIEVIAQNIRIFLANNEYPLWALKNYMACTYDETDMIDTHSKVIDLFCELISSGNTAGREKSKIAEEIYRIYKENAGLSDQLALILSAQNLKAGMKSYIQQYKPEIVNVTARIGIGADEYILSLNKKLSADSSYLWEVGDTERQIDNLFEDYLLIDAINGLLPETKKSLDKVSEALNIKLNLIKIPHSLITATRPDLANIFEMLFSVQNKTIHDKGEVVRTVNSNKDDFNTFFNNQYALFANIIKDKVEPSLSNDEIDAMFKSIVSGALFEQIDVYTQNINIALDKFRKDKKINHLFILWREATGTDNPKAWSEQHTIPISCLFQEEKDVLLASKVFDILNRTRIPSDSDEIDKAIDFINRNVGDNLKDITICNAEFKKYFSGVYDVLIDDVEELKKEVKKSVQGSIFEWTAKKSVIDKIVEGLAARKYEEVYKEKVKVKIRELKPDKVQQYLEELIEDKPLVGINILLG